MFSPKERKKTKYECGSFNCLFSRASAKYHAKSDILSSHIFQLLPVQSRNSIPYNKRCTQFVGAAVYYSFTSFLRSFVIFWCKKNGIFTLKNEILKHAVFASEWRKSRFRGLGILKFSGRMHPYLPPPPTERPPLSIEPPLAKNLDRPRYDIIPNRFG